MSDNKDVLMMIEQVSMNVSDNRLEQLKMKEDLLMTLLRNSEKAMISDSVKTIAIRMVRRVNAEQLDRSS